MGKRIVTYFICFFLAVCLFIMMTLGILTTTIFNKSYMITAMEKSEYYNNVYYKIKDDFEELSISAGVEASELAQIYDLNQVISDINKVIDGIYKKSQVKIDTEPIIEKIDKIINDKLEANNRVPSTSEKKSIETFEKSLAKSYVNNIAYNTDAIKDVADVIDKAKELSKKVLMTLLAVCLILLVAVFVINKNFRRSFRGVAIAVFACGILSVFIPLFIGAKVQNVLILSSAFSKTLIYVANAVLNMFWISGLLLIVTGFLAVMWCNYLRYKK